jgi:hypothetical protein
VALKFLPEGMGSDEAALDLATGAVSGRFRTLLVESTFFTERSLNEDKRNV